MISIAFESVQVVVEDEVPALHDHYLSNLDRLWEAAIDWGFWSWSRHGDFAIMSAELELAVWSLHGERQWTTYVEPPWTYALNHESLELDVMGKKSVFPVATGPRR